MQWVPFTTNSLAFGDEVSEGAAICIARMFGGKADLLAERVLLKFARD